MTTVIPITNAKQLPTWLYEPRPDETLEQAVARIREKYHVDPNRVRPRRARVHRPPRKRGDE